MTSRYADVGITEYTDPATGRRIVHRRRRIIPDLDGQPVLAEHRVTQGERLDVIAARYTGDPERFWMLCDANQVQSPADLEVVGRVIRIVMAKE